jgi:hypothetical protein
MRKLRVLLGLCAVLALAAPALPAAADPSAGPPICSSAGPALSGSYGNLTIKGNAYVARGTKLTITGDLTLAPGSCLDAFTRGEVKVRGSVLVRRGAVLALGCTPGSIGPVPPCGTKTTRDTVHGNVIADHALTMYLDGDTIDGDVVSIGGGPGPTLDPYINFPIKDNTVGGNIVVQGWEGAWFGILRNHVGGNVVVARTVGVTLGEQGTLDSTEIVGNTIGANLICHGNSPAAQIGDSEGAPNTVAGRKIGECTGL